MEPETDSVLNPNPNRAVSASDNRELGDIELEEKADEAAPAETRPALKPALSRTMTGTWAGAAVVVLAVLPHAAV